jgi:hypothetical protein
MTDAKKRLSYHEMGDTLSSNKGWKKQREQKASSEVDRLLQIQKLNKRKKLVS